MPHFQFIFFLQFSFSRYPDFSAVQRFGVAALTRSKSEKQMLGKGEKWMFNIGSRLNSYSISAVANFFNRKMMRCRALHLFQFCAEKAAYYEIASDKYGEHPPQC